MYRRHALVTAVLISAAAAIGAHAVGAAAPQRAGALLRAADDPALMVQRQVTANRRGVMRIEVTCMPTAIESCKGRLSLIERRDTCACGTFGTASFAIPACESAQLRVKLNRAKTALLVKRKVLRVKSIVVANDAANNVSTTLTPLTIRLAG